MILYHYTSLDHLRKILETGEIKLTASNLLRPTNPSIINGRVTDETDSYKPVVWFTDLLDFNRAKMCGLIGSTVDKTEAAIMIEAKITTAFYKWDKWAIKNNIEIEWFNTLKKTAPLWKTFYVSEVPIKITGDTRIIFRPDIKKSFDMNL